MTCDLKLTGINPDSWELLIGSMGAAVPHCLRAQEGRGKAQTAAGGQKTTLEAEKANSLQCCLQYPRKRLSCKDWIAEPLQTLLSTGLIMTNQGTTTLL